MRKSERMCTFRDIGFRGHWKKIPTDCNGEDWKIKPNCYYDTGYGESNERRMNYTWVWEQPNCDHLFTFKNVFPME